MIDWNAFFNTADKWVDAVIKFLLFLPEWVIPLVGGLASIYVVACAIRKVRK